MPAVFVDSSVWADVAERYGREKNVVINLDLCPCYRSIFVVVDDEHDDGVEETKSHA